MTHLFLSRVCYLCMRMCVASALPLRCRCSRVRPSGGRRELPCSPLDYDSNSKVEFTQFFLHWITIVIPKWSLRSFSPLDYDSNSKVEFTQFFVSSVCPSVTFMLMSALLLPEPALLRVCSDFHAIFADALPDIRPTYLYPLYTLIYPGTGIKEGI